MLVFGNGLFQWRQHGRRTAHAETRGQQSRPVHKARDDALAATAADCFHDVIRESIVIRGKGNRAHVFNKSGRHITSLSLQGDEVERRQRRKRYVPLTDAELTQLKTALAHGKQPVEEANDQPSAESASRPAAKAEDNSNAED